MPSSTTWCIYLLRAETSTIPMNAQHKINVRNCCLDLPTQNLVLSSLFFLIFWANSAIRCIINLHCWAIKLLNLGLHFHLRKPYWRNVMLRLLLHPWKRIRAKIWLFEITLALIFVLMLICEKKKIPLPPTKTFFQFNLHLNAISKTSNPKIGHHSKWFMSHLYIFGIFSSMTLTRAEICVCAHI